ncbi:MAG: TetR/AcrR family transcriptional regulator [Candidatus Dormibacteraceae bacterium]
MRPLQIKLSQEKVLEAVGTSWPPSEIAAAYALLIDEKGNFPSHGPGVGLPTRLVRLVQRERIAAAMVVAVADCGYERVEVEDVLELAGVSRPTFNDHFAGKEECFIQALDSAADRLYERISAAVSGSGDWRCSLRSGLVELLSFMVEEPPTARVLVIEAQSATTHSLERRDAMLDRFTCLAETTASKRVGGSASGLSAAGLVGGIDALLSSRFAEGDIEDHASLLPLLMYLAMLPYLGPEGAKAELAAGP